MSSNSEIVVRALCAKQGENLDVYSFFIKGSDIVRIADISRVSRDEEDVLLGFQRSAIKNHVKGIVDYLSHESVLFPNAIILAMAPEVRFISSRGTKPKNEEGISEIGTLNIPVYKEGEKVAWIVDGQQRSIALSETKKNIVVPVVAFVSDNLDVQREQFILVNKAKPLPSRLINELLPETTGILLPRELSARKIPSQLCGLLNRDSNSPFYQLIKRPSDSKEKKGVITDTAVINMIKNSLSSPLGILSQYKALGKETADLEQMYKVLVTFWSAVKLVFPDAWGLDPKRSRLMHSAGIESMGVLMDRIFARLVGTETSIETVKVELRRISDSCCWTHGTWEDLGFAWNEIQNTPRDIKRLQEALLRNYQQSIV